MEIDGCGRATSSGQGHPGEDNRGMVSTTALDNRQRTTTESQDIAFINKTGQLR